MTRSDEYIASIVSGDLLVCGHIKKACDRYLYDKTRDDLYWDQEFINKVFLLLEEVVYIPELRRKNKVPLPFAFWVEQLYGWKYLDGRRRFTDVYIQMARKNFKTFYAACVTLVELLLMEDTYPEILHGANSREQALICTAKTGQIIKKSPKLAALWNNNKGNIKVFTHKEEINRIVFENKDRRGSVTAMPKNPGDGGNPSVGIVDEFHEAKYILLLETIKSGQGQRNDPLTMVITSPGLDKSVPCYTLLRANAIETLNNFKAAENDRNLPIIFELDSEEEWDNPEMWEKSNPMIPYSRSLKPFISGRVAEAKKFGGAKAANIKIKNCGVWIDQASIFIPSEVIEANNFPFTGDLTGHICYAGLDLSAGGDLNAFCMLFPNVMHDDGVERHLVKMKFWIPSDKIELTNKDVIDYRRMEELGFVTVFQDTNIVQYDVIAYDIIDELSKYNVQVLACDRAYLANGPVPFFKGTGLDELIKPIAQGFSLSGAIVQLSENWCNEKKMNFMDNQMLKWNFANVSVKTGTSGDYRLDKEIVTKRIDGVDALLNAIDFYMKNPPENYEFWSAVG